MSTWHDPRGRLVVHGETVGTLEDAQREAVAHARRLGVIGEKDEVTE